MLMMPTPRTINYDKDVCRGTAEAFKCKCNHDKDRKCTARLKRRKLTGETSDKTGQHSDECFNNNSKSTAFSDKPVNAKDEIKEFVDSMAVEYFAWQPNKICKEVKSILDKKHVSWCSLTDAQMMNRVRDI